ncbi:MAG TPA: LamG-like jellyroll fold domain-containing protein [Pirellulaceae bacterium]|jgi:hypothetical protein|nr:LamG-like jellyroll fold domain-containing protein [Pirellulaceae bacterium]
MSLLSTDIKAWYDLTDGSGATLTDASGNGNHGSLHTPDWLSSPLLSASFDHVLDFVPGNADRVELNHQLTNQASFSVSIWVYLDTTTGAQRFLHNGNADAVPHFSILNVNGTLLFRMGASNGTLVDLSSTISASTWTHVALSYDHSTGRYTAYKNGSSIGTSAAFTINTNWSGSEIYVGRRESQLNQYLDGKVQQVVITNRALTSTEVSDLYNGGSGTTYGELFATPQNVTPSAVAGAGTIPAPMPSVGARVAFLQQAEDITSQTTFTFEDQNLGAADAERYIAVSIVARAGFESDGAVSSVTIAGVPATITNQITNPGGTNSNVSAIAIAAVPTGTTGDIVVTMNIHHLRCSVAAYRVVGIDGVTAYDSATSTATDPTVNLDIPAGGVAIAGANSAAADSATWTGLTEDFDDNFNAFSTHSGASGAFPSAESNLPITCNWSSGSVPAAVFASWAAAGSSSPAEATPSPVTAAGSVQGPTVTAAQAAAVSPASITGAGATPAPSIEAQQSASATADELDAAGSTPAPAVEAGQVATVTPDAVAGTGALPAPSLSTASEHAPSSVEAAGSTPSPSVSSGSDLEADDPSAAGSTPAPSIFAGQAAEVTPAAQEATGTVPDPVISTGTDVSGGTAGEGTVEAPGVSAGQSIETDALSGIGEVPAPAVVGEQAANVSPESAAGEGSPAAPATESGATASPDAVEGIGSLSEPSVTVGSGIAPDSLESTGEVPSAGITAAAQEDADAPTGEGQTPSPGVSAAASATPETIGGSGAVPQPTVQSDAGVGIPVDTVTGAGASEAPAISTGSDAPAESTSGEGSTPTPSVAAEAELQPSTVAGEGTTPAPSVDAGSVTDVSPSTVAGAGSVMSPVVSTGTSQDADPSSGSGSVPAPNLSTEAAAEPSPVGGTGVLPAQEPSVGVSLQADTLTGAAVLPEPAVQAVTGQGRHVVTLTGSISNRSIVTGRLTNRTTIAGSIRNHTALRGTLANRDSVRGAISNTTGIMGSV